MADEGVSDEQTRQALLAAIAQWVENAEHPGNIRDLAEAYAWVVAPDNGHRGSA